MSPITKQFKKFKVFEWTKKCKKASKEIKNWYVQALILINADWEFEFDVHTNAFQLALRAILA
jgi:ribosomal protein L11